MAVIDDKVVAMSFESSKFEAGVNKTVASLDMLKKALNFPQAGKGFDDINKSARGVDLSHISRGIDTVISKLGAMRLAAVAIFAQIAAKALQAGKQLATSLTLDPIKAGFNEYVTNLNSIQTIMANTAAAGTTLTDVTDALRELNRYSDKTIYNFSQMAANIGTFTAAGVDLDTSVNAIKGIANLAAFSGTNAEKASVAMYQLSQAISSGRVAAIDWISVVNAGMGGAVFQRALAQTAVAMGTLDKNALELKGSMKTVTIAGESFKNSLSAKGTDGWLNSKVLTATLAQFTGDLSDAELAAQGFNGAQIAAIQKTAKAANLAATEVKDLGTVFKVAAETAGSGWAQSFEIIFGTFYEAKATFTNLSNTINGFINTNADARNKVLADWKALGGRAVVIDAIKVAFHNLMLIIKPIKDAFREIFPAKTGKDLYNLTVQFHKFAEALKPSKETMADLKRTFAGLFAVLDIGKMLVQGLWTMMGKLFGAMGDGSGGFLEFTGSVGDWLVKVDEALKKGGRLHKFFEKLGEALAFPVKMIQKLADAISGFSSGGFSGQVSIMTTIMRPFNAILATIGRIAPGVLDTIKQIGKALKPAFDAYLEILGGFGKAIGEAAANMNFDAILAVIRTGLFAGIFVMFKEFLGKGSGIEQLFGGFRNLTGGILGTITGSFKALEGSMVAMQQNIKAKTLKEIAIAIALLTLSVVALSFIDAEGLKKGITAIGFMMGELMAAMAILDKISAGAGFIKLPIIAAGLIALGVAIDVLTIAVLALSQLSWSELLKGLGGVGALLGGISAAAIPLSANSVGLIRAGVGITVIAIAINLLALAVRQLGSMNLDDLAKGLSGMAIALGSVVFAMTKMPVAGMIRAGAGMLIIAGALNVMAIAVRSFGEMDLRTIAQGLGGIGVSLGIMVFAMGKMPTKVLLRNSVALVAMSGSLRVIASAVALMGKMSMREIAKGLIALGASMAILAIGLKLMSGSILGAIALGVLASSLALLVPVLIALGHQSWGTIIKGMIALGAAIGLLAGAALLLSGAALPMLAFGAALLLIGAGLALAGAGIFLVSTGLAALIVAAPTGAGIIVAAFKALAQGMIENAKLLVLGLLEIVEAFAATAPKFVESLVKIFNSLVDAIIQVMPKIEEMINALVAVILNVLAENQDDIIQAGLDLLISLLEGIRNNIAEVTTLVGEIIVEFIKALGKKLNDIVRAGLNLLISFIKGIANNISMVAKAVTDIIAKFITELANNWDKIRKAGTDAIVKFIKGITESFDEIRTAGTDAITKFLLGISDSAIDIMRAGRKAAGDFIKALAEEIPKLAQDVFDALIILINGMADVIENNDEALRSAGQHLGWVIIDGMTLGLAGKARDLYHKAEEIAGNVAKKLHIPFLSHSPSKLMMDLGENIILGLSIGMDKTAPKAYDSATAMSHGVIKKFNDVFQTASPSKVMMEIGKFVGQGFAIGLKGSVSDINAAWAELNQQLTKAMDDAHKIIISEQKKLKELMAASKPDTKAIAESQKIIAQNQAILAKSTAAHDALLTTLKKEKGELLVLSTEYEKVSNKLQRAEEALDQARQTRKDFIQSTSDQYATLPEIANDMAAQIKEANAIVKAAQDELTAIIATDAGNTDKIEETKKKLTDAQASLAALTKDQILTPEGELDIVATYLRDLKGQTEAVKAYDATLQQLRKLGLDDATYQKLVEEGTADQSFATQLLAGGKTAVKGLNQLDKELKIQADKLGKHAGKNLYDAGVAAAYGLMKGLTGDKARLIKEIEQMADEIVAAFNRRLKIKSPSRVFMEMGVNIVKGLVVGLSNSTSLVTNAMENVADGAVNAMQQTMRKISDVVMGDINSNPIITPILDLTQVRSAAGELGALTNVTPITAAASYGQASLISAQQTATEGEDVITSPGGTAVKFEQNNYSPTALSEIDIYRQTKNQLSMLKTTLGVT